MARRAMPSGRSGYDGTPEDIFAFQDDLTRNIVQSLQITLNRGEAARLWEGQTRNLRAWEKAVQALKVFFRYTTADAEAARRLFEEAIALDPKLYGGSCLVGSYPSLGCAAIASR